MNSLIDVTVVSPTETLMQVPSRGVQIPGMFGEMGVLPNHAAAIVELKPGVVKVIGSKGEETASFFVAEGFFRIYDNKAVILAKTVEPANRIDRERAQRAEERALKRLEEKDASVDIARALGSLARARARKALAELQNKKKA